MRRNQLKGLAGAALAVGLFAGGCSDSGAPPAAPTGNPRPPSLSTSSGDSAWLAEMRAEFGEQLYVDSGSGEGPGPFYSTEPSASEPPVICQNHYSGVVLFWNGPNGVVRFPLAPPLLFVGMRGGTYRGNAKAIFETVSPSYGTDYNGDHYRFSGRFNALCRYYELLGVWQQAMVPQDPIDIPVKLGTGGWTEEGGDGGSGGTGDQEGGGSDGGNCDSYYHTGEPCGGGETGGGGGQEDSGDQEVDGGTGGSGDDSDPPYTDDPCDIDPDDPVCKGDQVYGSRGSANSSIFVSRTPSRTPTGYHIGLVRTFADTSIVAVAAEYFEGGRRRQVVYLAEHALRPDVWAASVKSLRTLATSAPSTAPFREIVMRRDGSRGLRMAGKMLQLSDWTTSIAGYSRRDRSGIARVFSSRLTPSLRSSPVRNGLRLQEVRLILWLPQASAVFTRT